MISTNKYQNSQINYPIWWKWPDQQKISNLPILEENLKKSLDQILHRFSASWSQHRTHFSAWTEKKEQGKFFIAEFYELEGTKKCLRGFVQIQTPLTIYCIHRETDLSWPSFVISSKFPLPQGTSKKIKILIDVTKGVYYIKRRIHGKNEFYFLQHLSQNHPEAARFGLHKITALRIRFPKVYRLTNSTFSSSDFANPSMQWKMQMWQPYSSQDLFEVLATPLLQDSISLRIDLCFDLLRSIIFLHHFPKWQYPDENGQMISVEKTAHHDIKPENYVLHWNLKKQRYEALLIDLELAGNQSEIAGTIDFYDPQKALMRLLLKQSIASLNLDKIASSKETNRMLELSPMMTPISVVDFLKLTYQEKQKVAQQFVSCYGQHHDIWALGLNLFGIIENKLPFNLSQSPPLPQALSYKKAIKIAEKTLKKKPPEEQLNGEIEQIALAYYLNQYNINREINLARKDFLQITQYQDPYLRKKAIVIFEIIKNCLQISYSKRITATQIAEEINKLNASL